MTTTLPCGTKVHSTTTFMDKVEALGFVLDRGALSSGKPCGYSLPKFHDETDCEYYARAVRAIDRLNELEGK